LTPKKQLMHQNALPTDDFSELRSRAEQSLQKNQVANINLFSSPEEMLQLIHEQAVYQIELEIQQQKLIQSKEELEKNLERYTDLYDFAPTGYLTLAPDSKIVELNLTASTILDVARSRLRGKWLKNFIALEDRLTFASLLEKVFSRKEPASCEVKLSIPVKGTLNQKTVHIEAAISDNGEKCRAILTDISSQKKIEQAMLITNERQQLIIDATHSGSWEWNLQTNRTIWSNELWRLLGLEPCSCEATCEIWKQSILDEDRKRVEQVILKATEGGQEFTVEWRVNDSSGQKRWVMSKGTPFKGADGQVSRYVGIVIDITELKMAQEIGKKEQAFSQTIIDSVPGTFYIVGADGRYTAWNAFQRDEIVGKTESEMRHVLAISTIHPDDRELVQEKIKNVLEYGLEENVEGRVLVHGGPEFRWYLMTGRRIIMEGNPFLIGIGIDITERKKIEAIQLFLSSSSYLSQKEPFFNALTRYIAKSLEMDFACIDSLEGDGLTARTLAVWSDGHFEENVVYTLYDTPCGDVVGNDVSCFPSRVRQLFPHNQVLKNLQAESYVGVTLKNHAGRPIGLIAVIGRRPLVHRKFAETMLKLVSIRAAGELERLQSERALQASEQNYRELFESVPIGLYQLTMDGKVIAANQHYLNISKCQISDHDSWLAGDTLFSFVNPEERVQFRDLLLKQGYLNNFEADFCLRDGTVVTLSNTAKIVFNEKKEPVFITGSLFDITERKQNDIERLKLEVQLQQSQKMEMVGRLAGGIAHDFNNMLTVILGHSEMALELFEPSNEAYTDLEAIRQAATRSADLTQQLLAFARKQIVTPIILKLNTAVEKLLPMLRRLIGEHITLAWISDWNNAQVNIDPSQIDQILINLCINSRDSITGNGTITIECCSHALPDHFTSKVSNSETLPVDYVTLSVRDDGSGIDKIDLQHIFEPFFTTKEQGKGTGLGLSTIYGIVKQNNGTIECRSEPGKGTIVTIYLPLCNSPSGVIQDTVQDSVPVELKQKGHQTILLVEDELPILKLSKLILERNGYIVLAAATPSEAISKAENYHGTIDLLLTDVIMPEMNGSALTKKLHASRPELKTLFMSGYTADIIANNGVLDNAINFIQKPITITSLTRTVYNILNANKTE
jgi:two-component system, cell cycle sensor histidine kinase and response regulator CckA